VNKEVKKELQKQQRLFQELEARIAKLNQVKADAEKALADPGIYSNKDKFSASESEYKYASSELEKLNLDYEKIFEKIMELEAQAGS
jgi:ATP-binding cassette subfamily F protein 3